MVHPTRTSLCALTLALGALPLGAAPAAASQPPVSIEREVTFSDDDPCTPTFDPEEHQVSFQITARLHMFETASGLHLNVHEEVQISTDSGYAGSGVNNLSFNRNADVEGETFTFVLNHLLRHPDGRAFRPNFRAHITVVDGEPVISFERGSLHCLQTPAA